MDILRLLRLMPMRVKVIVTEFDSACKFKWRFGKFIGRFRRDDPRKLNLEHYHKNLRYEMTHSDMRYEMTHSDIYAPMYIGGHYAIQNGNIGRLLTKIPKLGPYYDLMRYYVYSSNCKSMDRCMYMMVSMKIYNHWDDIECNPIYEIEYDIINPKRYLAVDRLALHSELYKRMRDIITIQYVNATQLPKPECRKNYAIPCEFDRWGGGYLSYH